MKKQLLSILLAAAGMVAHAQQTPKAGEKEISEVTITKRKKAVEQKADRTIFDFSEQPQLNTGSALEGIKQLPGMVITDIAGMMYQGKPLAVYMDGRPLNISSNELNSFLEGMPANSIERIEVITQPGAEFPATSGGAILNIITSKNARNYLSATYSGNYSFSNYDKFRSRTNNSINLNARNKWFGWQFSGGQNYREGFQDANIDDLTFTNTDRISRGYFAKGAVTVDIANDRLLLNYDLYRNNNHSYTHSEGLAFGTHYNTEDLGHNLNNRDEAVLTYQKRFSDPAKKLDMKAAFTHSTSDFSQENLLLGANVLRNDSDMKVSRFNIDYSQPIKLLDEGKISFGGLYERQSFETSSKQIANNLDYNRQTAATYLELQAKLDKFDFILGTRAEDYDIYGTTKYFKDGAVKQEELIPFNKFKFFPNASVQYNFMRQVYFALNYNKKISLPSISALNPNNNTYTNPNSTMVGNPDLQPTIFDNYEAKLSLFDYAFIGYNVNVAKNQVAQIVTREGDVISNRQMNIAEMKIHNFNVGLPIPFMVFTKPLKEIMNFNFNPDKINFVYLYAGYQKHSIPDLDTKGFWLFNIMSQIILPADIRLTANYFYLQPKGNFYYFIPERPIGNTVNLTLAKKFMKDRLTVSAFANDIFNGQNMAFRSVASTPNVYLSNNFDSRNFGISVNYKIPTRNKLAKEDPNLLNQQKQENNTGGLPQTPQ